MANIPCKIVTTTSYNQEKFTLQETSFKTAPSKVTVSLQKTVLPDKSMYRNFHGWQGLK